MKRHTRLPIYKSIVICLSLFIGAFIAFKVFRAGIEEVVHTNEIVQKNSASAATEEDLIKMNQEIESFRASMPEDEHNKVSPSIIKKVNEYLDKTRQAAEEKINLEEVTKKEAGKPATPKSPGKKQPLGKPQETTSKKDPATAVGKIEESSIVEPAKPVVPKETATPTVSVRNNIKKEMTGYRKFGKNWYPDDYSVTINGVLVDEGEELMVPAIAGSSCNVVFAYDFRPMGKSYKKGTEEVTHVLSSNTKILNIAFSWRETPNIIVVASMNTALSNQGGIKGLVGL